jgi:long-chain fatty acid transport protein
MMRVRLKNLGFALLALTLPGAALATNGYFSHGTSLAEKGLAGAGVAYSQDTLAAANNPAGMVWQGARYDFGATAFMPMRSYDATGGPTPGFPSGQPTFSIGDGAQKIDSENEFFLIPHFGYNWEIDSDSTIGISVFGNGGLNSEYKDGTATVFDGVGAFNVLPGTYGDGTAGVDLSQLFISTTYAAKISDKTSWGVSGIIAYQRFEAKGLANFSPFSTDPENLTNNSHDAATGIGIRLGFQTEIWPGIRFGAAYQPEIDMGEFDDYAGLFAEDGDFNIPSNFTLGLAIDVKDHGVLVIDIQQINYEDVGAVSNPIAPLTATDTSCSPDPMGGLPTGEGCLGGDDGAGFGWEDMTVVKIGYQWQDGDMTWRVGYSNGDQPIPSSEVLFNILAPGVIEEHITFGFTRQIDAQSSFDFAVMYAPSNSVKGDSPFDTTQEIELEMDQYELAFSYNRRI